MSLRNRLVIGVLFLTAVGLVTLGAVTYVDQRSFLYQKIDQQIRAAPQAIAQGLAYQQPLSSSQISTPQSVEPETGAPAGTYGQLRDSSGKVQSTIFFRYNEDISNKAVIPPNLPLNKPIDVGSYRVLAVPVKETKTMAVPTQTNNGVVLKTTAAPATIVAAIPLGGTQAT